RGGAGVPLANVSRMPFCGYHGRDADTLKMMDKLLSDPSSGVDQPAAIIVEAVQGEGGLNVAEKTWLQGLEKLCRKHDMLLILDDIQAGCGRTGSFFSFEHTGIKPDMITLSKSLSGFGLPLAVVLMKPELEQWKPGGHNGTLRGSNHGFGTAAAAVEHNWRTDEFSRDIEAKSQQVGKAFKAISERYGVTELRPKGRGLMQGLECRSGEIAERIARAAFARNLIIETAGNRGQVVKCFCPLTIDSKDLQTGLERLSAAIDEVIGSQNQVLGKVG